MSDQPTSSAERDAQPPAGAPPSAPPPTQNGKRRPVSAPQSGTPGTPGGSPQGGTPQGQRKPPQRKPQGGPNRRDEMDFGHIMRTVLLWAAMLLGVVVLVVIFNRSNNPTEVEISTSEYQRLLD
ncbi:MAG: hypothetical protein Q8922_15870, partial [Bacteroidota bacterium]|nr:hypothetical protein [Bacteroidota bacterium]